MLSSSKVRRALMISLFLIMSFCFSINVSAKTNEKKLYNSFLGKYQDASYSSTNNDFRNIQCKYFGLYDLNKDGVKELFVKGYSNYALIWNKETKPDSSYYVFTVRKGKVVPYLYGYIKYRFDKACVVYPKYKSTVYDYSTGTGMSFRIQWRDKKFKLKEMAFEAWLDNFNGSKMIYKINGKGCSESQFYDKYNQRHNTKYEYLVKLYDNNAADRKKILGSFTKDKPNRKEKSNKPKNKKGKKKTKNKEETLEELKEIYPVEKKVITRQCLTTVAVGANEYEIRFKAKLLRTKYFKQNVVYTYHIERNKKGEIIHKWIKNKKKDISPIKASRKEIPSKRTYSFLVGKRQKIKIVSIKQTHQLATDTIKNLISNSFDIAGDGLKIFTSKSKKELLNFISKKAKDAPGDISKQYLEDKIYNVDTVIVKKKSSNHWINIFYKYELSLLNNPLNGKSLIKFKWPKKQNMMIGISFNSTAIPYTDSLTYAENGYFYIKSYCNIWDNMLGTKRKSIYFILKE